MPNLSWARDQVESVRHTVDHLTGIASKLEADLDALKADPTYSPEHKTEETRRLRTAAQDQGRARLKESKGKERVASVQELLPTLTDPLRVIRKQRFTPRKPDNDLSESTEALRWVTTCQRMHETELDQVLGDAVKAGSLALAATAYREIEFRAGAAGASTTTTDLRGSAYQRITQLDLPEIVAAQKLGGELHELDIRLDNTWSAICGDRLNKRWR